MDYNSVITGEIVPIIERIIWMVDRYSENYKLKDLKITVDDSDLSDLGNYIATGTTCEFRIDINYLIDGEDEYRYAYLTVPRMINGMFIIQGKYKMLSRYLGEDHTCRRVGNYFRLSYLFSYIIPDRLFELYDQELEDQVFLTFEELQEQYPDMLKLTEHQALKLKIKLNLKNTPDKLTKEIVDSFEKIEAKQNDIIDKRIMSIESILTSTLRSNMIDIVRAMTHNFYNRGTLSTSAIQRAIIGAFNGQMASLNALISSTNVNPLSFDSTDQKIIVDNSNYSRLNPGNYDITMADIIDPFTTPDNANINRINHLTKAADVKDGYIAIKCYDKDFNPVEVNYVKYCASTILLTSEVEDYDKRIVKKKSQYNVMINRIKGVSSKYDYIEPSADDRLSVEARMLPMINLSDSVRGSMAAKMITQAVPLSDPDTPRVMSGHEGDNELSTTDIKFESTINGEVIKADSKSIIVMVDGIPKEYKVPSPAVGIYDITAVFTPKVKVGDIVHTGDTLITHDIAKTGTRNLGVNALVALRPYRGLNYEDGIVISESFAKKMNHYSLVDVTLMLRDDSIINSLLPIGTKVKAKDILVDCFTSMNETNEKLINLLSPEDKSVNRSNNLVTPNNIDEGYVTDVKIQYDDYVSERHGQPINKLGDSSVKKLEQFKRLKAALPDFIPAGYRAQLPPEVDYDGFAACIRYRLLVKNPAIVGSKLCNRYGSKGLVAKVVPDSKMDKTVDGRLIDVILNSDAVIARKNISQIPEVYLANIADAIKKKLVGLDIKKAKEMLAKYSLDNYSSMKDEDLIAYLASDKPLNYITGCFSRFTVDTILKWMKELEVEPNTYIIDGETGRPVKNPVLVGSMYMMKLYQLPEHYNKVHGEGSEEDPILGKGLYRDEEGQSQGGLETYSLMASDLEQLMHETRKKDAFRAAEGLLINLRLAGINIRPGK